MTGSNPGILPALPVQWRPGTCGSGGGRQISSSRPIRWSFAASREFAGRTGAPRRPGRRGDGRCKAAGPPRSAATPMPRCAKGWCCRWPRRIGARFAYDLSHWDVPPRANRLPGRAARRAQIPGRRRVPNRAGLALGLVPSRSRQRWVSRCGCSSFNRSRRHASGSMTAYGIAPRPVPALAALAARGVPVILAFVPRPPPRIAPLQAALGLSRAARDRRERRRPWPNGASDDSGWPSIRQGAGRAAPAPARAVSRFRRHGQGRGCESDGIAPDQAAFGRAAGSISEAGPVDRLRRRPPPRFEARPGRPGHPPPAAAGPVPETCSPWRQPRPTG